MYLLLIFTPPSTGFGGCLFPSANEVVLGRPLILWPDQQGVWCFFFVVICIYSELSRRMDGCQADRVWKRAIKSHKEFRNETDIFGGPVVFPFDTTHTHRQHYSTDTVTLCTENAQNFFERNEQTRIDFSVRLLVSSDGKPAHCQRVKTNLYDISRKMHFILLVFLLTTRNDLSFEGGHSQRKIRSLYHCGLIVVASTLHTQALNPAQLNRAILDFEEKYSSFCCEAPRRCFNINFDITTAVLRCCWLPCALYVWIGYGWSVCRREVLWCAAVQVFFSCVWRFPASCRMMNFFLFVLGGLELFFTQNNCLRWATLNIFGYFNRFDTFNLLAGYVKRLENHFDKDLAFFHRGFHTHRSIKNLIWRFSARRASCDECYVLYGGVGVRRVSSSHILTVYC